MNARELIKYAATFAAGAYAQHKYTQHQVFRDPAFLAILDEALTHATEADIGKIIRLDPEKLRDWAMAPPRLKGPLLEKWAKEGQDNTPFLENTMLAYLGVNSPEEAEAKVSQKEENLRRRREMGYWRREWASHRALVILQIALAVFSILGLIYVFGYH